MTERASDAERERAVEVLRAANAEGRLEVAELEQRLDLVLAARTREELEATAADLPATKDPIRRHSVHADAGYGSIDLTDLQPGEKCALDVECRSGAVDVRVPAGTRVLLAGENRSGATTINVSPAPGGPVLHLHQSNTSGSIRVTAPGAGVASRVRRALGR
ncbi:MAG: DUF1707 SHOCT-like domain-containing protein [Solirubrobacteraceae bacterium]